MPIEGTLASLPEYFERSYYICSIISSYDLRTRNYDKEERVICRRLQEFKGVKQYTGNLNESADD